MEETPLEAIPSFAPQKRKINRRFIYLIIAIIVLALLFLGYNSFGTTNKETISQIPAIVTPSNTPIPSPTSQPTQSVTKTPSPTPTINPVDKTTGLDRSKLSISVENGSGETGVAGKASDLLKNLGYSITSAGNADNFDYSNVVVSVKSSKSDYLNLLQKDLGFNYTIGSTSSDLSDGFSTDALVIIGK